jgi:CubicO group peptidase (beta-lactamase class C family)
MRFAFGSLAFVCVSTAYSQVTSAQALIDRAKPLEIQSPYEPPPGERLEHEARGYARVMCNAVFITGLDPGFAAENVGYFTAPYEQRVKLGKPDIDRSARTVKVSVPNGPTITAKDTGSQGCITLPFRFKPATVLKHVDPSRAWPAGDARPDTPLPAGIDQAKVKQAVESAFDPDDAMTAAFVAVWKGRIIAERYGRGVGIQTPLESWSMAKSLTATLLGTLIKDGAYRLNQPAPIPEWQRPGDPRAKIRIEDLLHMSSGLRCRAPNDPDFDASGPYPDHLYLYTTPTNAFRYAATRPLQWPPNTVGRYRNTEPVLVNYLIRMAVEKRGGNYFAFPQTALFDKLGIGTTVMETDPEGNFLAQGYVLSSARDWARIGMLYLSNGVWNGERILPEGYAKFVSTLAPAWKADGRPIYGGFFWLNGDDRFAIPRDAYSMMGAGGQFCTIIPSHNLVVVRMGHFKGAAQGEKAYGRALQLLTEAVGQEVSSPAQRR